jgi:polyribonucleotide nucleotidyltransferase
VHIYASQQAGLDRAKELIERMSAGIEVGKVCTGKVVSTTAFGAFVDVSEPGPRHFVAGAPSTKLSRKTLP